MHGFYVILILSLTIHQGMACQCFGDHIQNEMCSDAGAVFRGYVSSVGDSSSDNGYASNIVQVQQIYMDTSNTLQAQSNVDVLTPTDQGLCIYTFTASQTYLIFARVDGNTFKVNGCSLTSRWPSDQAEINKLINLLSSPDCSCSVRTCERPFAGEDVYEQCLAEPAAANECVYDKYGAFNDEVDGCGADYSICKSSGGKCDWDPELPGGCIGDAAASLIPSTLLLVFISAAMLLNM